MAAKLYLIKTLSLMTREIITIKIVTLKEPQISYVEMLLLSMRDAICIQFPREMDQSRPKKGRLHRRILASLSWVAGLLGVEVPCSEGHGVPTQEYSLLKLTCQVSSVNKVGMIGEMKAIKVGCTMVNTSAMVLELKDQRGLDGHIVYQMMKLQPS